MVKEPIIYDILEVQIKALEASLDVEMAMNKHLREENDRLRAELQAKERHRHVEFGNE